MIRVQHRATLRMVLVVAARVALETAHDAVVDQRLERPLLPRVEEVVVEGVATSTGQADVACVSPLTGKAILNSIIGRATGWEAGHMLSLVPGLTTG